MARCAEIDTHSRFLAVDLAQQLQPGTFEQAPHHLLETAIDLSGFDARLQNDATGAVACHAPTAPTVSARLTR